MKRTKLGFLSAVLLRKWSAFIIEKILWFRSDSKFSLWASGRTVPQHLFPEGGAEPPCDGGASRSAALGRRVARANVPAGSVALPIWPL